MAEYLLNPEFFVLKDRYFPEIQSISCRLSFNEVITFGRGDSWDLQIAKVKALAEALERLALKKEMLIAKELGFPLSSNGIAFHYERSSSMMNSKLELIEREVVMRAWGFDEPVQRISFENIGLPDDSARQFYLKRLKPMNLKVSILNFGLVDHTTVIGVSIESEEAPYLVVGYSANPDFGTAINKAFIESCIVYERFKLYSKHLDKFPNQGLNANKFLRNLMYYAENQTDLALVFSGLTDQQSCESNRLEISSSQTSQSIFDMKNIGLPGFICRSTNLNFYELRAGSIKSQYGKRKPGEVHPIA